MEQVSLFEYTMPTFKIDKPIRLIELFAGIGSQAKALERIGVPFEHWRAVEFDKYAMASYNAVHGTSFETSDIRDIHADDLDIREREILLHHDLFVPMSRFIIGRTRQRNGKGQRNTFRSPVGSRADSGRVQGTPSSIAHGERATCCAEVH